MKSFLLLAVPDDHPYWQADICPLQIEEKTLALPESKNFYQYNHSLTHLQAFPAGQFVNQQSFPHAKYSKFVYSTRFGFSVPKSDYWYYEGAYDSTLALAKDGHYFRPKGLDLDFSVLPDRIIHEWSPWEDVKIRSTIIPLENCHVRVHEIDTTAPIQAHDGGFSVPLEQTLPKAEALSIEAKTSIGISKIEGIIGYEKADVVRTEPNTNLFYPRTMLPFVSAEISSGKHLLVSLVSGTLPDETVIQPVIEQKGQKLMIQQKNQTIELTIR